MIELRLSSIMPMLSFLQDLKAHRADENQIRKILNHPDYDFEFKRYEIESKEPMIRYFMGLSSITQPDIPILSTRRENMIREKHPLWLSAYNAPEHYEAMYDAVCSTITDSMLEEICERVKKGLPRDTEIGDVRIISTMSIGTSFGYVFDGALHFDLMGFGSGSLDTLPSLLAHEIHHLAMGNFVSAIFDSLTLDERYILHFSGEGLAIKFCNNAEGVYSKAIDDAFPKNEGLDGFSIRYLNDRFDEALMVFQDTLAGIRSGTIGEDEVSKQFEDFWWNPFTDEQSRSAEPLLKQTRIYTFGNDLYGSIYDAHGTETLFECIKHPRKVLDCSPVFARK